MMEYDLYDFAGPEFPFRITRGIMGEPFPPHTHTFTEMSIVLSGRGVHRVGVHESPLEPGELYVVIPPFSHAVPVTDHLDIVNFMFDLDKPMALDLELRTLPGFQALFVLEPFHRYDRHFTSRLRLEGASLAFVTALCQAMLEEFEARREGYRVVVKAHFLSLIAHVSRQLVPERESISEKYFQIAAAVHYMEEHLADRITLPDIAARVFLSERQFSRLFHSVYRLSPYEHLTRLRLERACSLLRTTRHGLGEIAVQCGFGDKVALSRQFQRVYGLTPGRFRKGIPRP